MSTWTKVIIEIPISFHLSGSASENKIDPKFYEIIHTENFVLVDSKRRIRGFYDGTDSNVMDNLINDIKILKKEESK